MSSGLPGVGHFGARCFGVAHQRSTVDSHLCCAFNRNENCCRETKTCPDRPSKFQCMKGPLPSSEASIRVSVRVCQWCNLEQLRMALNAKTKCHIPNTTWRRKKALTLPPPWSVFFSVVFAKLCMCVTSLQVVAKRSNFESHSVSYIVSAEEAK